MVYGYVFAEYVIAGRLSQSHEPMQHEKGLWQGTSPRNMNKNGARVAGAKVAPFLFMLHGLWVLELTFVIDGYWDEIISKRQIKWEKGMIY